MADELSGFPDEPTFNLAALAGQELLQERIRELENERASLRTSTEYAVAWGGDVEAMDGRTRVEVYDDEEDAAEHAPLYPGGYVARRTVLWGPWERVADRPAGRTAGDAEAADSEAGRIALSDAGATDGAP